MATEIELKFLVDKRLFPAHLAGPENAMRMKQGYLGRDPSVRVRLGVQGGTKKAWLTVKGKGAIVRQEFEYEIPFADGGELIKLAQGTIDKTRYLVEHEGHTWEVDFFHGPLEGLVFAEIELESDSEIFSRPRWATKEVTFEPGFTNQALSELTDHAAFLKQIREILG